MLQNVDRWAVVGQLVNSMRENQGWAGETHVQKTLFFLQELLNVPCGYQFVLYKHGPYSFDLHDDLGRMLTNQILGLEPRLPYGPSFGLEEVGGRVVQQKKAIVDQHDKSIQFIVATLGRMDVRELERLGTALLLKKKYPNSDEATLADRIVELKPHVLEDLALNAVREVTRIELEAKDTGLIAQS